MAKDYPKLSRYLIKEFLQAVLEVSIVELLALFVTFATHRRNPELAVRWASNIDCDYPWKLGRTNETHTLPGTDDRGCEEI